MYWNEIVINCFITTRRKSIPFNQKKNTNVSSSFTVNVSSVELIGRVLFELLVYDVLSVERGGGQTGGRVPGGADNRGGDLAT